MKVILQPGEKVEVEFADSDWQITVEFNATDITVRADLPDTEKRQGIIYQERFKTLAELGEQQD